MHNNELFKNYNKLNNSFDKLLVYRLGSEAGFFSEYNNMVFAIAYCLINKIKFTLSSQNANFSKAGWSDIFENFCPENNEKFHLHFNNRIHGSQPLKSRLKRKIINAIFKTYLTQDIWFKFRSDSFEKTNFSIRDLEIYGSLLEASQKIIRLTWKYQPDIESHINKQIEKLELPAEYLSIHIRKGDKSFETKITSTDNYIKKMIQLSTLKDIFISTDDFLVIKELKENYPSFNFFYLTEPVERGYYQDSFVNLDEPEKKKELIKLFSSIEIMNKSSIVVCTFTSNIGLYLAMRRGIKNTFDVNDRKWSIW